jgi:hypothetical protein
MDPMGYGKLSEDCEKYMVLNKAATSANSQFQEQLYSSFWRSPLV